MSDFLHSALVVGHGMAYPGLLCFCRLQLFDRFHRPKMLGVQESRQAADGIVARIRPLHRRARWQHRGSRRAVRPFVRAARLPVVDRNDSRRNRFLDACVRPLSVVIHRLGARFAPTRARPCAQGLCQGAFIVSAPSLCKRTIVFALRILN